MRYSNGIIKGNAQTLQEGKMAESQGFMAGRKPRLLDQVRDKMGM